MVFILLLVLVLAIIPFIGIISEDKSTDSGKIKALRAISKTINVIWAVLVLPSIYNGFVAGILTL